MVSESAKESLRNLLLRIPGCRDIDCQTCLDIYGEIEIVAEELDLEVNEIAPDWLTRKYND